MIVTDASVVSALVLDDGVVGEAARNRIRGQHLRAPTIVDLEVLSFLRRQRRANIIDERRCAQSLDLLASLPVRRVSHRRFLPRIWELRDSVSPYAAAYVALAEAFGATLLTADKRLAAAHGPRCAIEVLEA